MREEPQRISDLCRNVPDASKKTLIESVQRLERPGLVQRRDLSGAVKHVEYQIKELFSQATSELLKTLAEFPLLTASDDEIQDIGGT
jgi:DNA-binding HxlR family transcriptional regulator